MRTPSELISRPDCLDEPFALPPVPGTKRLLPLDSWRSIYLEAQVTGIEFDAFWYEGAVDGICQFFSWLAEPRGTVLVIIDLDRITHVECRKVGDRPMTEAEVGPILAELAEEFANFGVTDSRLSNQSC